MAGASSLDAFLEGVCEKDNISRQHIYPELVGYLREPSSNVSCEDFTTFLDGVLGWVSAGNPKVVENGLELLALLATRMCSEMTAYLDTVFRALTERFADKERIQDRAANVFVKLATNCSDGPTQVCERLLPAFSNKQMRVREGAALCVQKALAEMDPSRLPAERLGFALASAYGDPLANASLKQVSSDTLVELYRQVGESVRTSVQRCNIPEDALANLLAMLDSVSPLGASDQQVAADTVLDDDNASQQGEVFKKPTATKRPTGRTATATSQNSSGAVNDEIFLSTIESTPRVELYSIRDLGPQLQTVLDTISDLNKDWNKRTAAMRTLRGLIKNGTSVTESDEFVQSLRLLETAFQTALKDLRSVVIREACITIAYLAQQMGNGLEHFVEAVVPNMLPLIPNTIAVIASSALVGVRFVISHVHSLKLVPVLAQFVTHKAKEVRAAVFNYVAQILRDWPEKLLERQREKLLELTKKGLRDADATARQHSRDAFKAYAKYFRESALQELDTMDSRERKTLGELINRESDNDSVKSGASASAGTFSKRGSFRSGKIAQSAQSANAPSAQLSLARANSQERPLAFPSAEPSGNGGSVAAPRAAAPKSASTSDYNGSHLLDGTEVVAYAVPSASVASRGYVPPAAYVSPYAAPNGVVYTPTHGTVYLPAGQPDTHAYRVAPPSVASQHPTAYRTPNHRVTQPPVAPSALSTVHLLTNRPATASSRRRVAASQPGSRSGSPPRDSPDAAVTMQQASAQSVAHTRTLGRRTPSTSSASGNSKLSRIPRSVNTSREPSPARSYTTATLPNRQNSYQSPSQVYMHHDMNSFGHHVNEYVAYPSDPNDDGQADDPSETSSVSRFSDTSRRYRGSEDLNEIMAYMASAQWQDRRNGLAGFQCYLANCRPLEPHELKAITDFFTRFFNDPNAKVFTALLDTLTEFIPQHRDSLYDWMYIPLTRLLLKLGSANLLGSVETRILQALDIVRNNFPLMLQFSAVCRFIIDQTQTPNCKAKLATLKFLVNTIEVMTASDFVMDSDNKLAVARLITWTVDKQSPDLRKAAALCIFKLFDLNAAEFIRLLRELSRVFQDGAYKLLIVHVRGLQSVSLQHQGELALSQLQLNGLGNDLSAPLTPGQLLSPTPSDAHSTSSFSAAYANTFQTPGRSRTSSTSSSNAGARPYFRSERGVPSPTAARPALPVAPGSDVENMNPEAIMQDIAKTTADIARLTVNDDLPPPNRTPQSASRLAQPSNGVSRVAPRVQPSSLTAPSTRYNTPPRDSHAAHAVQPAAAASGNVLLGTAVNNTAARTAVSVQKAAPQTVDTRTVLANSLDALAALNDKYLERKVAFGTLVQLARLAAANSQANAEWNEQFRRVLFSVLETLKDNDARMRYVALLSLDQMIEANGEPFCLVPEMTMLKLFEMHRESATPAGTEVSARDMTRYADDCLLRLGLSIPKQVTLHVVINVIKSAEFPLDLAALKLVTKLIDHDRVHAAGATMRPAVLDVLGELAPAVLLAYNSPQGALRKASVFCLVSIILLIGDSELRVYLEKLPAPKLKLLEVYIKRAREEQAAAGGKTAADDAVVISQTLTQDFDRCLANFWKS